MKIRGTGISSASCDRVLRAVVGGCPLNIYIWYQYSTSHRPQGSDDSTRLSVEFSFLN